MAGGLGPARSLCAGAVEAVPRSWESCGARPGVQRAPAPQAGWEDGGVPSLIPQAPSPLPPPADTLFRVFRAPLFGPSEGLKKPRTEFAVIHFLRRSEAVERSPGTALLGVGWMSARAGVGGCGRKGRFVEWEGRFHSRDLTLPASRSSTRSACEEWLPLSLRLTSVPFSVVVT